MPFDIKKQNWRISIHKAGCTDYFYTFAGNKREAMKEATDAYRGASVKGRGYQQKGSIYKNMRVECVHHVFGTEASVCLTKMW